MSSINFFNMNNMDFMKSKSNNSYDLAIVDPPYGYGKKSTANLNFRMKKNKKDWNIPPSKEYFDELFRVSKNQIIWGGNYFPYIWNFGGRCFIYWHKGNPVSNFADGELAWTSFDKNAIQIDYRYYGSLEGNKKANKKIHVTEKPKGLYDRVLKHFGDGVKTIIDTHGGSGNIALSCLDYGFDLDIIDIDEEYYNSSIKRFNQYKSQLTFF